VCVHSPRVQTCPGLAFPSQERIFPSTFPPAVASLHFYSPPAEALDAFYHPTFLLLPVLARPIPRGRDAKGLLYDRAGAATAEALRAAQHQAALRGLQRLQPSLSQMRKGRDAAVSMGRSLRVRKAAAGKKQSLQSAQICPSAPIRWKQIKTETAQAQVSVLPLISTRGGGSGLVLPFLRRFLPLSLGSSAAAACCPRSSALNVNHPVV